MIDTRWAKGLVEAARSILWDNTAGGTAVKEEELLALAGLRPPSLSALSFFNMKGMKIHGG